MAATVMTPRRSQNRRQSQSRNPIAPARRSNRQPSAAAAS